MYVPRNCARFGMLVFRARTRRSSASPPEAQAGQILVMFAVVLTGMLGAVGLSMDLGFAFAERRSMQSAADAGALAGVRLIAKQNKDSVPASVQSEVEAVVQKNKMSVGSITHVECNYVTDTGAVITPCVSVIPPNATGVELTVTEQHPTYFIRVIPGAPNSVSTNATARAHVKKLSLPTDGPYLPCGNGTQLAEGGTFNLAVKVGSDWQINPLALGKTFVIHGPQVERCNAKASRYKGLADTAANRNLIAPGWFYYKEGDTAGFISVDVAGPDGCKAGQEVINCVVFLPIVVNDPVEAGNNRQLWCIGFAPFYITAPGPNVHWGKLMRDYLVAGKGQDGSYGWNQDYDGPITIRLTK
jgi:Flp pilus assembly protein TadG